MNTLAELIDELTYRNYAHNRRISPNVSPERWAKSYGPTVAALEERFLREHVTECFEHACPIVGAHNTEECAELIADARADGQRL